MRKRRAARADVQISNLSKRSLSARDRAFRAVGDIKNGASQSQAARQNHVSARTIRKYAGSALEQQRPGARIHARENDDLWRYLQIPGRNGPIEIDVRGSEAASEVAMYKRDVNRALAGDPKALEKWRGKKIAGVELITDLKVLAEQDDKGLLPYALYRSLSGNRA